MGQCNLAGIPIMLQYDRPRMGYGTGGAVTGDPLIVALTLPAASLAWTP